MKNSSFPLVEIFGHPWNSAESRRFFERKWCPFAAKECEKYRQYGFGYCSVTYATADDAGEQQTYAVCDHRLDGAPIAHIVRDHFGDRPSTLVSELVLTQPRTSFDYVAFAKSDVNDIIAIETQAIDIRGGGVGPAWEAWKANDVPRWREFFTEEATKKGRKDVVAYGVNMANIYKRLGLQVAVKGTYLKEIAVPFYVLMQDRPFQYLRRRISFVEDSTDWDITFVTFDYGPAPASDGTIPFTHRQTIRTSLANYLNALSSNRSMAKAARVDFLERVKRKAGLTE